MSWLAFKSISSKCWIWFKAHWQIPLLLLWSMVVYFLSRRNSEAIIDVLNAKKDSYEKQIKELKKRHNDEIIERDKLIAKYHETISIIEKKYAEKEKQLSSKEKKRIKEIVETSKGEADVVRKEIEKSFGFTFIE